MLRRRGSDFRLAAWNHFLMRQRDLDLRNLTYRLFVEMGRAPTAEEVAVAAASTTPEVQVGSRRLHDQHALVPGPHQRAPHCGDPIAVEVRGPAPE